MKFDLEWLMDHLDGAPDADTLADRLTACGLLVEVREAAGATEVWDIEVTTNRPDVMNHLGLAREAAVATSATLKSLDVEFVESGETTDSLVQVDVEAPEACTRFCSRVVRGIEHRPSPEWLQRRLSNCGVRPISAVVDITNYVMLTLGQPLHAYDLERVAGRRLVARMAQEGEKLTTLDGEVRELTANMPVIADGDGPVGLAGLMGGADSEISGDTVDVWLEAANFDAITVRRMARRLGMHTEASHRFERGADPELPPVAVDLAAAMIAKLAGGTVCPGRVDVRPRPWQPRTMTFEIEQLSAFAGLEMPAAEVLRIFTGLGFAPVLEGQTLTCLIPSWRIDIDRIPDLYEEVIRHIGYDQVPAVLPILSTTPGRRNSNWELVDRARGAAVAVGLAEAVTYAFVDPKHDALAGSLPLCPGEPVELANPLASTQSTLRRSLLIGLLSAVRDNLNQGERNLSLFEQGRVFATVDGQPEESERLALAVSGRDGPWNDRQEVDFGQLKGAVDGVLGLLGVDGVEWRRGGEPWLEAGEGAVLELDGRTIGYAGRVAAGTAERWDLKQTVYVAELDLGVASAAPALPRFAPLPRFPAVTVDMTVEHPDSITFAELDRVSRELATDDVEDVCLVARFSGKGLAANTVRTTLRLIYRREDRSLTQDEVNTKHEALRQRLGDRLQVRFT